MNLLQEGSFLILVELVFIPVVNNRCIDLLVCSPICNVFTVEPIFLNFKFHLAGAFEDPDIIHVDDSIDPVRDLEVISAELRLKVLLFLDLKFMTLFFGL